MSEFDCEVCGEPGDIYEQEYLEDTCPEVKLVAVCQSCVTGYAQELAESFGEVRLDNVSTPPWAEKA